MDHKTHQQNPYAPPTIVQAASDKPQGERRPPIPIIPAVIGMFTYGSTSPYALVLCVEQYMQWPRSPVPWTTHVALLLSIIGTLGWIGLNIACFPAVTGLWVGNGSVTYASLGLAVWCASLAFLIWLVWRILLFRQAST